MATKKTAAPNAIKTAPSAKPPVAAGHPTKAQWRKPQAGTMRARVLAAMIDEPKTVAEIAAAAGIAKDRGLPHVYATWCGCGIGHKVVDGNKYVADRPVGETRETIFGPAT